MKELPGRVQCSGTNNLRASMELDPESVRRVQRASVRVAMAFGQVIQLISDDPGE